MCPSLRRTRLPVISLICVPASSLPLPPPRSPNPQDGEVHTNSLASLREFVLNRPKQLNALTLNMVRELTPRLQAHEVNDDVNTYIIRGVGDKAFCAGGDVVALHKAGSSGKVKDALTFFREEYRLNYLVSRLAKPYIAWLNGVTMGGGVGLSVHGRFRVATENTYFAMPETAIGFFPDVGGSHFLSRLENDLGTYLALTGARLRGSDTVHAGIATHFAGSLEFPNVFSALVDGHDREVTTLEALGAVSVPIKELPPFTLAPHMDCIQRCFSKDSVEDIVDALKAETVDKTFAADTLKTLQRMSPQSLKVTLRALRQGASLDLDECLQMEYDMAAKMMLSRDFYEGVGKVLLSKDRKARPEWLHHSLAEVTPQVVDAFFKPTTLSDPLSFEGVVPASRGTAFKAMVMSAPFVTPIPKQRMPGENPYPLWEPPLSGDAHNPYHLAGKRGIAAPKPGSEWLGYIPARQDPGNALLREWRRVVNMRSVQ